MWTTFKFSENRPKVNNPPLGENSPNRVTLVSHQGVQIGLIFAYRAIHYFGQFYLPTFVARKFVLLFHGKSLCFFSNGKSYARFWKNGLGYILGDFSQTHLGPMLWFLKYFRQNFLQKNKAKLCKNWIITLVFEKNGNFFAKNWQKSQKIVIITSVPGHPSVY
jgi:hypothetical protein